VNFQLKPICFSFYQVVLSAILFSSYCYAFQPPKEPGMTVFDRFGFAPAPDKNSEKYQKLVEFRGQAKPGGQLRLGFDKQVSLIFPYPFKLGLPIERFETSSHELIYQTLAYHGPLAMHRSLEALVAQRFWIDLSKGSLLIQIDPKAHFSDGSVVTARDIEFSWQQYLEAYGAKAKFVTDIFGDTSTMVLNDQFIRFQFGGLKPDQVRDAVFYILIAMKVVKPNSLAKLGEVAMPMIGTGPYFVSEAKTDQVNLSRDQNYWARDISSQKGLYNFDELKFSVYRDRMVEKMAVTTGQLSRFSDSSGSLKRDFGTAEAEELKNRKFKLATRLQSPATSRVGAIAMNLEREHLQNLKFRQAIALAYDFDTINNLIFSGEKTRLPSPGHGSRFSAPHLISADALKVLSSLETQGVPLPADIKKPMDTFGFDYISKQRSHRDRLRIATDLLQSIGYKIEGPRLVFNGKPVILRMLVPSGDIKNRSLGLFQRNLELLGITLERVELVDWPAIIRVLTQKNYDLTYTSLPIGREFEALNIASVRLTFYTNKLKGVLPTNSSSLSDPLVDKLIDMLAEAKPSDGKYRPIVELLLRAISAQVTHILTGEGMNSYELSDKAICMPPVPDIQIDMIDHGYYSPGGCTEQ
jgi:microcin C transport system substrate-binding protein